MGAAVLPMIGAGLDAAAGVTSAIMARSAFKHRYQDTVKDMRKAGLNPALAYGQGGGNPQTSDLPDVGSSVVRGVQGAASAKQAAANADLTSAQATLLKAQTADLIEQVKQRNAEIFTHTTAMGAQAGLTMMEQDKLQTVMQGLQLDNDFKKATLADRVDMVQQDLKKKGVEISYLQAQRALAELARPEAQANADFYSSQWGRNQPYINSAKGIAEGIGSVLPKFGIGFLPGQRTTTVHNYPRYRSRK